MAFYRKYYNEPYKNAIHIIYLWSERNYKQNKLIRYEKPRNGWKFG